MSINEPNPGEKGNLDDQIIGSQEHMDMFPLEDLSSSSLDSVNAVDNLVEETEGQVEQTLGQQPLTEDFLFGDLPDKIYDPNFNPYMPINPRKLQVANEENEQKEYEPIELDQSLGNGNTSNGTRIEAEALRGSKQTADSSNAENTQIDISYVEENSGQATDEQQQ